MVILNTASERRLSTYKMASYSGLGHRACEKYLLSMKDHGLVTSHHEGNRSYWSTTLEGKRLAIDIENIFERAGIELRKKL